MDAADSRRGSRRNQDRPARKAWLLALLLVPLWFGGAPQAAADQRLLLLYSYHPGFPTSPKVLEGLRAGLGEPMPTVDIEYMDSKRVYTPASRALFLEQLRFKLRHRPPYDLVVTADDNALRFVLDHGSQLLPQIPVVFLGVNDIELALAQDANPGITGVVEAASFYETIRRIRRLLPQRRRINIIVDPTTSGQADLRTVHALRRDFADVVFAELSLAELDWTEFTGRLERLGDSDAILFLSAYRDRNGTARTFGESLALVREHTGAPIFHLWEHGMGDGVLGGVLVSHAEQGRRAGLIARAVLDGTPISDINVVSESPNVPTFDFRLLNHYGINRALLGEDTRILFEPESTWYQFRREISVLTLGLLLLVLYVVALRRQVAVRQRYAGEVANREARLRAVVETIPDLIWLKDEQGHYLACNRRFEEFFGAAQEDIVGKTDFDFVDHELASFFRRNDLQAIRMGGPCVNEERITFASDGHEELLETIKTPVVGPGDELIGVLGIGRDITERQRADALRQKLIDDMSERIQELRCIYAITEAVRTEPSVDAILGRAACLLPPGWHHPEDTHARILFDDREYRDAPFEPTRWVQKANLVVAGRNRGSIEVYFMRDFPEMDEGPFLHEERELLDSVARTLAEAIERDLAERRIKTLSQAVEQSPVSVVITDPDARIEYVNQAFEQVTGYTSAEVLGRDASLLSSGQTPRVRYEQLWQALGRGKSWQGEFINRRKNGEIYWEQAHVAPVTAVDGSVAHYLAVKTDISSQKRQEEKILRQAHYDNLTDLPNRLLALDRLRQMIKEAERGGTRVAVLFLDLDDFKKVNDTLGHEAGDRLLVQAARRLRDTLRASDTVGRLGGDEFIVLLGSFHQSSDILPVVDSLLNRFRRPFDLDGRKLVLTLSLGIAVYPDDGATPAELLRCADTAMYHAKENGRNTCRFFTSELNENVSRRLVMEEQLRGALERAEFEVHFQPLIDLDNARISGAEALLRWNNPELGQVRPDEFIPIAEHTGTIVEIGHHVLERALEQAARWRQEHDPNLRVSVNVSPRQFRDPGLARFVREALDRTGLPPQALELEITEGVLLVGHGDVDRVLDELHRLGVGIAMDDFGTGYSSLSYLRSYPFSSIKIDRSFVHDITLDAADRELVNAIIVMGHGMGLQIVAEGIESTDQLADLRARGCDYGQGYLFSQPLDAVAFGALLARGVDLGETISTTTPAHATLPPPTDRRH